MTTPKKPDQNSNRTKKRKTRGALTLSRPERRAERRLGSAMATFKTCSDGSYKKPGAQNMW